MLFDKSTRILVVAAHPDDEVLGCGGTIAKAKRQGAKVGVLFLGEGISARFTADQYESIEFKQQTEKRYAEAKAALDVLQVDMVWYRNRLCTQFDTYSRLSIVKDIEAVIEEFKPTMLFTHNPSEVNVDHEITYYAVETACRPTRDWLPKAIYTFEIICSGTWKFNPTFKPNVFVDVSKTWDIKIKAWQCYAGEFKPLPSPRSVEGLDVLAKYRGLAVGRERVEAFSLLRKIII